MSLYSTAKLSHYSVDGTGKYSLIKDEILTLIQIIGEFTEDSRPTIMISSSLEAIKQSTYQGKLLQK